MTRPLRVAYGCPAPHGGGALNYLADLVTHHDRARVEPVVWLDPRIRDAASAVARMRASGAEVRSGLLVSAWDQFLRTSWWSGELRGRGPFDVANLHQPSPGMGRAFLEGARRAGAGLLVRTEQLPRFPPLDRPARRPAVLAWRWARRRLAAITDVRIAVAEGGRRALVGRGEPADTIRVVRSAYREEAFEGLPPREEVRRHLGVPADATVVGFLASLAEQKRPDLYLDAAERLLREGLDATFVIGGSGPWTPAIEARARAAHERIVWVGHRTDLPAVLSALDVFVLPSMWEGLPLTVLEAMRAGAAVVATDVDGTPDVVRDGETGRLVPPGDAAALADAVGALVRDPAARRRIAEAGRAFVRGRFDAATLARATEDVYDEALRARAGRPR